MNPEKRAITCRLLGVIILFIPVQLLSQTDKNNSATISDTVKKEISTHSLYSTLGYGNNLIYLGSTISQDQPFGYSAFTYGYRDRLYLTVSAIHLEKYSPFVAFSTGSLSYSHTFNSWFDISAGLSGYLVAYSLADTLFSNFLYGDITLGIDWKILYTKISAGALVADEAEPYIQIRNSRYFQTPEFSKKNLSFSFDPYFNLLFGSLTTAETTTGTITNLSPPYRKGGKYGQTYSTNTDTTRFRIMEADFGIPVSFNSDHFTIEAEPGYVMPLYDNPEYPGLKGFVFLLTVYFRIF
ncbi:MAG: hypothetical protein MUC93_10805 [Bacteroidales bacterium]|jgi:hypothetical protein|nr:hypothetical protein [Bacteroidales bacterium]